MRVKKRVTAKVMWYFPLIPRLKCLFMNKTNAKLMWWHKEERKQDNMLRHPADGSQWRKVDRTFPIFADHARNISFGLSTDGMNPFGEQSSGHSTWPVTLCIYNLPPWLCMKRKFVMMPVLIPVGAYQHHQRWRPQTPIWGGSISWTTNKSASARNTAVVFYPGVYWVSFIFPQGRRWVREYIDEWVNSI